MIAEELAGIPTWVDREIVSRNLPRLYAELASVVQANANGSPQAFENQRDALIRQLKEVDINSLSDEQSQFIRRLNLLDHVGAKGVDEVEDTLYRNALDVSTAAATLNRIAGEIQNAVDRSNQVRAALSGLVDAKVMPSDEFLIRVVFDREASIDDVVDLKKWANDWHDIARGFAMAVNASPKELRVVGASTGSIILTLATTLVIARLISSALLKALEVAEKVQGLRKMALEIEALKLSNADMAGTVRIQADEEKRIGLDKVAAELNAGLGALNGEQTAALEKSVKKLLAFLEKGGEVDVVLPLSVQGVDDDSEFGKLRDDVERIRELERETRRLTHIPSPSAEENND